MFSGIIETIGEIAAIENQSSNIILHIASPISKETYVDQSISHNGVCLTVISKDDETHAVEIVRESLNRSNFAKIKKGDLVNLERSVSLQSLMDGHLVQGHIDCTALCQNIEDKNGSWDITFQYSPDYNYLLVDKGSVSINGVSLTVIDPGEEIFKVSIIPYTMKHTNFKTLKKGDWVNLEFDIVGKYIARYLSLQYKKP